MCNITCAVPITVVQCLQLLALRHFMAGISTIITITTIHLDDHQHESVPTRCV